MARYIKNQDQYNANRLVMTELGRLLAKDKSDFIEVLRSSNITIPDNATDIQLINAFVDNAPSNRKLLLGASFMISHKHQTVGFDGEQELSDSGVKATYKVMYNYFDASSYEDTSDKVNEDYYDATGEDYSNAGWGTAVSTGLDIANKFIPNKNASSDALAKKQDARQQMVQSVLAQRQAEADNKAKVKEAKAKNTKTLIIVGGAILGLVVIAGIIFAVKKSK
ncbi:MAG: hypothetical protein WCI04_03500 [archaeon]